MHACQRLRLHKLCIKCKRKILFDHAISPPLLLLLLGREYCIGNNAYAKLMAELENRKNGSIMHGCNFDVRFFIFHIKRA